MIHTPKTKYLLAGLAVTCLIIAVLVVIFMLRPDKNAGVSDRATKTTTTQERPAAERAPLYHRPPVPETARPATALKQMPLGKGLFRIPLNEYPTTELAGIYSFVQQAIDDIESPDGSYFEPLPLPPSLRVADVVVSDKNLSMVFAVTEGSEWCLGNACSFNLYMRRADGFQSLLSLYARADAVYTLVDNHSFSVIVCDGKKYQRWVLADGALDRPLRMDAPGYFIPEQTAFANPGMVACGTP